MKSAQSLSLILNRTANTFQLLAFTFCPDYGWGPVQERLEAGRQRSSAQKIPWSLGLKNLCRCQCFLYLGFENQSTWNLSPQMLKN